LRSFEEGPAYSNAGMTGQMEQEQGGQPPPETMTDDSAPLLQSASVAGTTVGSTTLTGLCQLDSGESVDHYLKHLLEAAFRLWQEVKRLKGEAMQHTMDSRASVEDFQRILEEVSRRTNRVSPVTCADKAEFEKIVQDVLKSIQSI